MSATVTSSRRTVHYNDLDEFVADAEQLAAGEVRTIGNWTYGQILQHLGDAFKCTVDGYGFKAPWIARYLIAPLVKNQVLSCPMRPGFKLPASAKSLLPQGEIAVSQALRFVKEMMTRYRTEAHPHPHPFLGYLAEQEWESLHLRHTALHMSFVHPAGA